MVFAIILASLLSTDGDQLIRVAIVNAKELETYWKQEGKLVAYRLPKD